MIKLLFKCILTFSFCFIVLSFNVSNKPLFFHISEVTGPIGTDIQESISKSFKHTYSKSKKLFTNSVPQVRDSIKSQKSALTKEVNQKVDEIEELRKDEIKKLDDLIRNN